MHAFCRRTPPQSGPNRRPAVLLLAVLLLAGAAGAAGADDAPLAFTLKEAQAYAVSHSTETRNARIDVAMAHKKIWETTAGGLPQVSAALSYRDNLKIPTTLIPAKFLDPDAAEGEFIGLRFGTQHNATLEITASQLVFNGSYIVALRAAKVYLQLARDQQEKREIDVRQAVAATYQLVLLAEENRRILASSLENMRRTLDETTAMHQAGFSEATAVDQLQLAVSDLENTLETTGRQIEAANRVLKLQMGLDQERRLTLRDTLASILEAMDAEPPPAEDFSLAGHIDLRIIAAQERSMSLLLQREKAEYLPSVTAFLSLSQSAMRDRFDFARRGGEWFPAAILGLNLSVPVFTSGLRPARVAQAKLELEKTRNLKKQVADGLQVALAQARSDFIAAREREKNTARLVALAQRILDDTRFKFSQGLVTTMELTQVHNQYLGAESGHVQAIVQLLDARLRLDKALNRL